MAKLKDQSADRLAEYFVEYLFKHYGGSRHVRRVAAWIGLVILGIQRGAGKNWHIQRSRQLWFHHGNRIFKVKYDHHVGGKAGGGIEIVEVLPGKGSPEGESVAQMRDLAEAEQFYNQAPVLFNKLAKHTHAAG
jgi:hypothetical protein